MKKYDYYILKIKCGCEVDGLIGPFPSDEAAETRIHEMSDDPAYSDISLFVIKIDKKSSIDVY